MGFGFNGSAPNQGLIFVPLKPQNERMGKGHSASDIVAAVAPQMYSIPGGIIAAFEPPAIQGIGNFGGFQFELQDNGRNTLSDLDRVAHTIVAESQSGKVLTGLYTSFTAKRSPDTCQHRSRQGEEPRRSALAGFGHAWRIIGVGVHKRL